MHPLTSLRPVALARMLTVAIGAGALFSGGPDQRHSAGAGRYASERVPVASGSGGRAFYFARATYRDVRGRKFGSALTDYPKADQQFLIGLHHLTNIDAYENEHPVRLDDPALRRYPFLYAVEVGHMYLSDEEVHGLRDYLLAGGFRVVDDFWGSLEWASFESQIRRVLPQYPIRDIPLAHPVLNSFYNIDEIIQVPNIYLGRRGGRTYEQDGYVPSLRGIFDDRGRLMVLINWNTDLGDAWEWAEDPFYPIRFANYAYQMGVNMIVYGMSH